MVQVSDLQHIEKVLLSLFCTERDPWQDDLVQLLIYGCWFLQTLMLWFCRNRLIHRGDRKKNGMSRSAIDLVMQLLQVIISNGKVDPFETSLKVVTPLVVAWTSCLLFFGFGVWCVFESGNIVGTSFGRPRKMLATNSVTSGSFKPLSWYFL